MLTCPTCGTENPPQARFCFSCGAGLEASTAAPREARKVVTVVFSDVAGSTRIGERLDPEALRRVMSRYFDVARAALERHGGTVEKFIGDAVMAVFGVPTLHEDDALRAVRAAVEMRDAVKRLNDELETEFGVRLETRIGVNTGEVVVGDETEAQRLATGDAVNVAARLEQAAGEGEVLLGPDTYMLVRDAVQVDAPAALAVKGKSEAIAAYRLLGVTSDAPTFARRLETPLVGRERERRVLREAFERAVADRSCHLFTVLGHAGVGKSRLAAELVAGIGTDARTLTGRCLPYGDGITFWPLVELVSTIDVASTLAGLDDGDVIEQRVAAVTGGAGDAGGREETFWAVRRVFEMLARDQPLVLLLDDLHWAEPTFLDLVEHVADWSRDAPILLLCLARAELLELRPGWGGGKVNASTILLEPLSETETDELIERLLGEAPLDEETRERIRSAAEGNPLFVEQMLALRATDGGVGVPATIQALLAARLDRLPLDERAAIERAAIEGKVFHQGAVAELSPPETRSAVAVHLSGLLRKQLIHPEQSAFPAEQAYRFGHLLIRDAAYEALPKQARAALHEQFATWLERVVPDRLAEFEEILAWHLEQAYRYRVELGPPDDTASALGLRGAKHMAAAGLRAYGRGDMSAAASLLRRALALPAPDAVGSKWLAPLATALVEQGEYEEAARVAAELSARATRVADANLEARALLVNTDIAVAAGGSMEEALVTARRAATSCEKVGDLEGLAHAWLVIGRQLVWLGRTEEGLQALERAAAVAQEAGSYRERSDALGWLAGAHVHGRTPNDVALERVAELGVNAPGDRLVHAALHAMSSHALARQGRFDEAREQIRASAVLAGELGMRVHAATLSMPAGELELLAGDATAAQRALLAGADELRSLGEKGFLSSVVAMLAEAELALGRLDDADRYALESEQLAAPDDQYSQILWRVVRARTLALRGEVDEGIAVARAAVEIGSDGDGVNEYAQALEALGDVLALAGRTDEAADAFSEALAQADAKGSTVLAERLRNRLSELEGAQI